jgi:hypothetical protein
MRYTVFETTPYGAFVKAGDLDAACDREALKHARLMIASGAGELRHDIRTVCRLGRAEPFLLQD